MSVALESGAFRAEDLALLLEQQRARCWGPAIFALPGTHQAAALRFKGEHPSVAGVVCAPLAVDTAAASPELGWFVPEGYDWELPACRARDLAFAGPREAISFWMALTAWRRGVRRLHYLGPRGVRDESVSFHLFSRAFDKVGELLMRTWMATRLGRTAASTLSASLMHLVAHRRMQPLWEVTGAPSWAPSVRFRRYVDGCLARAPQVESREERRIVLINSSLAWGGAERQLVNTLKGLSQRGFADLHFVYTHLTDRKDHDFFLRELEGLAVTLHPRGTADATAFCRGEPLVGPSGELAEQLPFAIQGAVGAYVELFRRLRPTVVHAWQDATCIEAALAALWCGVPTIVLSTRNMAPVHFGYHQSWMRDAYRALLRLEHVVMLNNSRQGRDDYADWLGVSQTRVRVVYNGVQPPLSDLDPAAAREALGLPPDAVVVGSIFRHYPEKDPRLWLEVAERVLEVVPDAWFLQIGAGVMTDDMRRWQSESRLGERLLMIGTHREPAIPLKAMDVFLLTSRFEGTPNVLIEAQLCGVPVVTTAAGGAEDCLLDGTTGYVVRSRDPRALAGAVVRSVRERDWAQDARPRARAFARERFSLERMLADTTDAYRLIAPACSSDTQIPAG